MDASADSNADPTAQPAGSDEARVEALLFASDAPLTPDRIAKVADLPGRGAVREAVHALNARYEQIGASFRIEQIANGYQMLTCPAYHGLLEQLFETRKDTRLSQAALETLAVVAYRQPVLRADIEAIRGVACGEVLRGLMDKQLVKIVGRAEVLGRPMLYGTTRRFLEVFGLASLEDLPKADELRIPPAGMQAKRDTPAPETDQEAASEAGDEAPAADPSGDADPRNKAAGTAS